MNSLPIDPNLMPLINGVKPYLGSKAKDYADMFTGMMKLLSSNSGREVITTMSRIMLPADIKTAAGSTTQAISPQMYSPNIAFSLFLVLVLLIFATGGMNWAGLIAEEANKTDACNQPDATIEI